MATCSSILGKFSILGNTGDVQYSGKSHGQRSLWATALGSQRAGHDWAHAHHMSYVSDLIIVRAQSCLTLCDPVGCCRLGSSVRGDSAGKNTGVGGHALLQGIFPTQGSNPGLPHCGQILYQLSHKGGPWILEWVAYSFSRGSSRPRDRTGVSYVAGGFFPVGATREAQVYLSVIKLIIIIIISYYFMGIWIHESM